MKKYLKESIQFYRERGAFIFTIINIFYIFFAYISFFAVTAKDADINNYFGLIIFPFFVATPIGILIGIVSFLVSLLYLGIYRKRFGDTLRSIFISFQIVAFSIAQVLFISGLLLLFLTSEESGSFLYGILMVVAFCLHFIWILYYLLIYFLVQISIYRPIKKE